MIGVGHSRLDDLSRDRRLSRSKNYPGLLFALSLGLSRHSVLQRNRDRDVADLNGLHRNAPVVVLRPISPRNRSSAAVRSDRSADNIDDPIISRSDVWETRSIQSRLLRVIDEPKD